MSYCDHCQGQRFDRARVLRALRQTREDLRRTSPARTADEALSMALKAITALDIPHLEVEEEEPQVVH
jgi:hypothetical protein